MSGVAAGGALGGRYPIPPTASYAATADAVVIGEPVGWTPDWTARYGDDRFFRAGELVNEVEGPTRFRVTAVLRSRPAFPPPAPIDGQALAEPPAVGALVTVTPWGHWFVHRTPGAAGFHIPEEKLPAPPPPITSAVLFLYHAERARPRENNNREEPVEKPASPRWLCPVPYFSTAGGALLSEAQFMSPGPVVLTPHGRFDEFVATVRVALKQFDLPDWDALPDRRARAEAALAWADAAAAEAPKDFQRAADAWTPGAYQTRFMLATRLVRGVMRSGPPDLAVRALLWRSDRIDPGWRVDPDPFEPAPFAGSLLRQSRHAGREVLLTSGGSPAPAADFLGDPGGGRIGTFGTAAGRAALIAATADPDRTPVELVLLLRTLVWGIMLGEDGAHADPPKDPAARIATLGRLLSHEDRTVGMLAATLAPMLIPYAPEGAADDPRRSAALADVLKRLHALPPGAVHNTLATAFCERCGLSSTGPADRTADARWIRKATGSDAAALVTLPAEPITVPPGGGAVDFRVNLHWGRSVQFQPAPPEVRVVCRTASLTPADGGAPFEVQASGPAVEQVDDRWQATATLHLSTGPTDRDEAAPPPPGRYTFRLHGVTVPREEGEPVLEWRSAPGVLIVGSPEG